MTASDKHTVAHDISTTAIAVALLTVCSWLSIPLAIPITMQTYAVFSLSAILGRKKSIYAISSYILLCALGAPILSGFRGGIGLLLGNTGGYVIGFLFTALTVSWAVHLFGRRTMVMAVSMAIGCVLCYAFGTAWFVLLYTKTGSYMSVGSAISMCVLPYLIPDSVKIWLAIFTVNRAGQYFDKEGNVR